VPCPRAHAPNHFHQRAASWCNRLRSRRPKDSPVNGTSATVSGVMSDS
jgi:hypothetical protein